MDVRVEDRAVVVTGAASGIGEATARACAAAQARLLLTDRDEAGLLRVARDLGAAAVVADLLDQGAPARIGAEAVARLGRIDGLVNAAGITTRADFSNAAPEVWDTLFAVNARAPFFLMAEAIRDMRARSQGGAIVNVLSMNAHCGSPELAVYAATKGALLTLTKNAAHAHLRDGIRVNGVNLGWTDTPAERAMQAGALGKGEGWIEVAAAGMPLGRLLTAEEAARLCLYLLSDASAPMTGVAVDLEQRVTGAP